MSSLLNNRQYTGKILSFGELLLRFTPDADNEWLIKHQLPVYIVGAELNVSNALALWGLQAKYFTALPDNVLTAQIVKSMQDNGIDASSVYYRGNRVGLYYITQGLDLKQNALIYDRAHSAFAGLKPGMVDWDSVLEGVSWFHFSAICPALSQDVADVCVEVLEIASKKNITISVDMNYRAKLWQYGKSPADIMPDLAKYCDLIMGNIWAAEMMLGIPVIPDIHVSGQKSVYLSEALKASQTLIGLYPKCKAVANTFRFDATDDIKYYSTLYTDNKFYNSAEYETGHVVDKVGSGDCFMAGLIYGFYNKFGVSEILEFATAAAFGKLFIKGDATTKTVAEIKKSMK
jgi:2-dehydro-3-deoxygluconokinase